MLLAATSAAFSAEGVWDRLGWFGDKNARVSQTEDEKIECTFTAKGLTYAGKSKEPRVDIRKNRDGAFTAYLYGLRTGPQGSIDLVVKTKDNSWGKLDGTFNSSGASIVRTGCFVLAVLGGIAAIFLFPPAVPLCAASAAALMQLPSLLGAVESFGWGLIGLMIFGAAIWIFFRIKALGRAESALYNMTRGINAAKVDSGIDANKLDLYVRRFMSADEQKMAHYE